MKTNPRRRILACAVLLIWASVVAMHIRREYFKPVAMRLAEGARSLAPGSDFYVVRMNNQAIGFASSRIDTVAQGFVFEDNLILDVPAMNAVHRATARTRVVVGKSLQLRNFDFNLLSDVGNFVVKGEARGKSLLDLTLTSGGAPQQMTVTMDSTFVMDAGLPMRLAASGQLVVGRQLVVRVFDPSTLSARDATINVVSTDTIVVPDSSVFDASTKLYKPVRFDTIRTWKLEQRMGGIAVTSWVDEDGRVVRATSALGFTMERTDFDLARQEWKKSVSDGKLAAGYGSIINSTAIASNLDLGEVGTTDQLKVRLLNVDLAGFDLRGGRQRLRGDTLEIHRELPAQHPPSYTLPSTNKMLEKQLAAEPLIQSNDPAIVETARKIAGGSADPQVVAKKLNDWVYDNLKKEITLSVPSAVQVLQARKGDCNEHTVLYVALARALGLPTRTATGLVYVRGSFYYHAWPEVWLDRWVAVDPTLGQFPADASHIRFIVGDLARQLELIRLVGRLRLDVVSKQ
jgi:hypothetical protein